MEGGGGCLDLFVCIVLYDKAVGGGEEVCILLGGDVGGGYLRCNVLD